MRINPQFIPDLFGAVITAVDAAVFAKNGFHVYYDFGHYEDVTKDLILKDQAINAADRKKFPLVWLVTDLVETMNVPNDNYYTQLSPFRFFIAVDTVATYSGAQRRDNSFLPVLYPIYAEIMFQLSQSSVFGMVPIFTIPHQKIDRPYWGKQDSNGNNTANMFATTCDAIEIRGLKLPVNRIC